MADKNNALARLLAGLGGNKFGGAQFGGNTFGGNRFGGHQFGASAGPPLAEAPPPVSAADFAPKPQPNLPPFEQPGNSLPSMAAYMQHQNAPQMPPVTVQAQAPQPAPMPQPQALPPLDVPPAMPPMPPPQQVGPQAGIDPNDPRYLPEQWKGAFNPGWQGS